METSRSHQKSTISASILNRYSWILVVVWTMLMAGVLIFSYNFIQQNTIERAKGDIKLHYFNAETIFGTVMNSNATGKAHHALYELITELEQNFGVRGHLTSQFPQQSSNTPDKWEQLSLTQFRIGTAEILDIVRQDDVQLMRFMKPLQIKDSCKSCHEWATNNLGGAISISLPMTHYLKKQNREIRFFFIVSGLIWILGVLGILMVFARHLKQTLNREHAFRNQVQDQDNLIQSQQGTIETKSGLVKSLSRFVSSELIEISGESNVEEIQPGSFLNREMTILTADIKNFYSSYKSLEPQDKVSLINAYQQLAGPIIRENGGFISRRMGDSIMALFPDNPENGLKAAIAIQKSLIDFNKLQKKKKSVPLFLGIGLFSGNTLIANIGEEQDLETTLISKSVHFAWKMKYLAEQYGSQICTHDQFLFNIENKNRYSYRFLDRVRIGEGNDPLNIIEILNGMLPAQLEARLATKNKFENAIEMYQARNIIKAQSFFRKVFQENKNDKACIFYLERCHNLLADGIPDAWEAIENLEFK